MYESQRNLQALFADGFFDPGCLLKHGRFRDPQWRHVLLSEKPNEDVASSIRSWLRYQETARLKTLEIALEDSCGGDPPCQDRHADYLAQFLVETGSVGMTVPPDGADAGVKIAPFFSSLPNLSILEGDIGKASYTLARFADFNHLASLTLQSCTHTAGLLNAIAASGNVSLQSLVVFSEEEVDMSGGVRFAAALEKLLGSFTGLRTLVLSVETFSDTPEDDKEWRMPSLRAIAGHCATLRLLMVDRMDYDGYGHTVAEIRDLCNRCIELEPLGLRLTADDQLEDNIDFAPGDTFGVRLVSGLRLFLASNASLADPQL